MLMNPFSSLLQLAKRVCRFVGNLRDHLRFLLSHPHRVDPAINMSPTKIKQAISKASITLIVLALYYVRKNSVGKILREEGIPFHTRVRQYGSFLFDNLVQIDII